MVKRQRTAFPPNFVHSLDGSHMMMTAITCKEAGLSFAGLYCCLFSFQSHEMSSARVNKHRMTHANVFVPILVAGVHDSYWTHACDVDQMNKILREKFVELYDAPILEDVSFFKTLPF